MNTKPLLSYVPAVFLALGACTTTHPIPDTLDPGASSTLAMVVPAKGVQVYECRAGKGAGYEWAFVAPDADLMDASGKVIGRHGAGPYWQAADGSRVVASVKARSDAPNGAIPWLLLASKDAGPRGSFSNVTSIQRVNTEGGLAPSTACDGAAVGKQARVHYTADYRFFTSNTNR